MSEQLTAVVAFLMGEAPLRGAWFGERANGERGLYWWRKDLRAALAAEQTQPEELPRYADPFTYVIQHLNSNPYALTKDECINLVRTLRDRYTALAAEQAQPRPVAWEDWWRNHGQYNFRATAGMTFERAKELMKLAFEVGREAAPPPAPVAQQAQPVASCNWPECGCRADLGDEWKACVPDTAPSPAPVAQQTAVAWMNPETSEVITVARHAAWERDYGLAAKGVASKFTVPLYTAPPKREPLTDVEISEAFDGIPQSFADKNYLPAPSSGRMASARRAAMQPSDEAKQLIARASIALGVNDSELEAFAAVVWDEAQRGEAVGGLYDFPNPGNPADVIRSWFTQDRAEIERCGGFNIRALTELPAAQKMAVPLTPMSDDMALHIAAQSYNCRDAIRRAESYHGITMKGESDGQGN